MDESERRYLRMRRAAQKRYLIALGIIAIVGVVQFLVTAHQITDQRKQAQVVATAGRQRMLVVQIGEFADQLVEAVGHDARRTDRQLLRNDLDEFRNAQILLEDNDSEINPQGWPPAQVGRLFRGRPDEISRRNRDVVVVGLLLAAAPDNQLTPRNAQLASIHTLSRGLVHSYDLVVDAYIASGERRNDRIRRYEALGLAALLITLVLEVPLLFVPMQRAIDKSHRQLVREANMLARAQETARVGCWERDLITGDVLWSQQLRKMVGLDDGQAPPPIGAFNHPDDAAAVVEAVRRAMLARNPYSIDHRVITPRGETLWIRQQGEFEYALDGTAISASGTAFDINERKLAEEQEERFAYFDAVTGLPNRQLLEDRLGQALAGARRSARIVALLSINLDRFKIITDSLGHTTGDRTLKAVAKRLTSLVRESDTVARVGGCEFAIVLPELDDGDHASAIADTVIAACAQPYMIGAEEVYAAANIGIALYPLDASDPEALIRIADAAMYKAMEYPGGNFQVCAPESRIRSSSRLTLERELRRALERNELTLHYQPIVGLSRRAVAVEALIRWQHPTRGLISPDIFLPLAEETGLIIPIGDWVLRTACAQANLWQGFGLPAFRLTVNISTVQFRYPSFSDSVRDALASTGLPPPALELEITESVVMHDVGRSIAIMQKIRDMGVALSIDDFGTGYSSLSYLKQFPIDTLKIDRSFVSDLPSNSNDGAIVQAVLALASNLGLRVVAEGVETAEQLAYLRALQCEELQGYYFSRPLVAEALKRWVLADVQPVGAGDS